MLHLNVISSDPVTGNHAPLGGLLVDADLAARLRPEHLRRLQWFEDHAGEVRPRPEPLEGHVPLVHPRMGIYKPAELAYATAIVIMLRSPYQGDRVTRNVDGSWNMVYHQQDAPSGQKADPFTNVALHACQRDRIPVGVLQERQTATRPRQFEVLGLGLPLGWQSGYFLLQSLDQVGNDGGRGRINALLSAAEALEADVDELQPLPTDDYDARLRAIRRIVSRRGQTAFRASLLEAYDGRCAVTGCDIPDVLEAAHLRPYRGRDSNDLRNGLLLRADIHTLLDLMLIAFEPTNRTVVISKYLRGVHYQNLDGVRIAEPRLPQQRPAAEILQKIWQDFIAQEAAPTRRLRIGEPATAASPA